MNMPASSPRSLVLSSFALCLLLFAFLASTSSAHAQGTATLAGRVRDEQGAGVADARVTATNTATNQKRDVRTDDSGLYVFNELAPGVYRVRVERDGFRQTVVEDITLNVESRASEDFTLRVGSVTETVTVDSSPSLVESNSATVSTVVDRTFVENIPLNGRSFQSLIELTPGVVLTPSSATSPGQFSVNGQRTNSNYFIVDGVSANAGTTPIATSSQQAAGTLPSTTVLGGFNNLLSVDELQEFRVQTSTFAPEFGRSPGAQISLVSRSGANRFTGSVFDYVRNEKFDANSFFNNRAGLPRGVLRQNDFGFTLGGRVLLPRFGEGTPAFYDGRDKTFFFVSYEGLRLRQPVFRDVLVPSVGARAQAAPAIAALLNSFPLPNTLSRTDDPANTGRYVQSLSNPSTVNSTGVRLDHNFTDRFTVFGRYKQTPSSVDAATTAFPNQTNFFDRDTKSLTLGGTHVFSARATNDVRFNITEESGDFLFTGQEQGGARLADLNTLLPAYASTGNASVTLIFSNLINQTRGRSFGNGQRQINVVDDFSFVAGDHQLKFGVDYRRLKPAVNARSFGVTYNFGSVTNAITTSRATVQVQALAPQGEFIFQNFSAYAQDTWRATTRLTATYGVRYDINTPPSGDRLPFAINNLNDPIGADIAPPGTRAFETTYTNFAPRLGLAYSVKEGFVLRGGIGIFYDLATGQATRGYTSFPFNSFRSTANVGFPAAFDSTALQPLPFDTAPPYEASEFYVSDRDIKLPYTLQYNLALEKSLGQAQSISATYVGARGRRLLFTELLRNSPADPVLGLTENRVINPIFGIGANYSNVNVTTNRASSDYNALQVQFTRRLSRGFQALVSYTFAKSLDDASDEIAASPGAFRVDLAQERAPSDFDIRHTFTAAATYQIPNVTANRFARALLGGFALDALTRLRTAAPYSPLTSTFSSTAGASFVNRADLVAGVPLYLEDPTFPGGRRANPAAFAVAPLTRQGTSGRNILRAFPLAQTDLALRREVRLGELLRLQLRAEAFNVFNQSNFGYSAFNRNIASVSTVGTGAARTRLVTPNSTFGLSTLTLADTLSGFTGGGSTPGFNQLYSVGGARSLQFAVKLLF